MANAIPDSTATRDLLEKAASGDRSAFDHLIERHRPFLLGVLERRLDAKLATRFEPADLLQETLVKAFERMPQYLQRRPMPFRLWLWKTAQQVLINHYRDHVTAAKRSILREVNWPDNSSKLLARRLMQTASTPSEQLTAKERARLLQEAIAQLSEEDRELLILRYVEDLGNQEVAGYFAITPEAASKRHGRALIKLHMILRRLGFQEDEQ